MFERLTGKVLTRLLSKYFVQDGVEGGDGHGASADGDASGFAKRTQLGVWSGFVRLDGLVLRNAVVNDRLREKGLPFELIRCSVGRVELTVPWGRLGPRGGGREKKGARSSPFSKADAAKPTSSSMDGAVVVVVDSVHVLLSTRYRFDDDAVEAARVRKRREELARSEGFVRAAGPGREGGGGQNGSGRSSGSSGEGADGLAGFFKSRLKEGILNDVLDRVQIHIRNVHVRFEDVETDPLNPHACGLTVESVHVQSEEGGDRDDGSGWGGFDDLLGKFEATVADRVSSALDASSCQSSAKNLSAAAAAAGPSARDDRDFVKKLVQLNHLSLYWNELSPTAAAAGGGPAEISNLQVRLFEDGEEALAQAMGDCIARRAYHHHGGHRSAPSTPGRSSPRQYPLHSLGGSPPATPREASPPRNVPTLMHTYLLRPMDGSLSAVLSRDPRCLRRGPALAATLSINSLAYELRDFQYSRMLGLGAAVKYHKFSGQHRRRRPGVPILGNACAWWTYAIGVVRSELKRNRTQSSLRSFHDGSVTRRKYCDLYERYLWWQPLEMAKERKQSVRQSGSLPKMFGLGDGSGGRSPVADNDTNDGGGNEMVKEPLSEKEVERLSQMEDGIVGDLNVDEILFVRALVNARMVQRPEYAARLKEMADQGGATGSSFIEGIIKGDFDAEQEYERLVEFLEVSSEHTDDEPSSANIYIAVSLQTVIKYGSLSLFTPCHSSFPSRNIPVALQQNFIEFTFCNLQSGYTLFGNFKSFEVDFLLDQLEGSEIRSSGSRFALMTQLVPLKKSTKAIANLPSSPVLQTTPIRHGGRAQGFSKPRRLGSDQLSLLHKAPVMCFRIAYKPPRTPHFDVSIAASVEEVELLLSPHSEWPLKVKSLFTDISDIPDATKFWENVTMAYINTVESAKAGLRAKAALAFAKHKNFDVNVFVDCPIISVGDDEDTQIKIDLGNAYIVTKSLAGVARGSFHGKLPSDAVGNIPTVHRPTDAISRSYVHSSVDQTPKMTPEEPPLVGGSPAPSASTFTLGAPALSPVAARYRSHNGSISLASKQKPSIEMGRAPGASRTIMHSCFYDAFLVRLCSIAISVPLTPTNKRRHHLFRSSFSITVEKSVISSDHTIPQLKMDCVADELCLSLSSRALTSIGAVTQSWRVKVADEPTHFARDSALNIQQQGMTIGEMIGMQNSYSAAVQDEEGAYAMSDGSDEDDIIFLDALDGEPVEDDVSVWLEENWNSETDGTFTNRTIFGDSPQIRSHRTRLPSVSDVSSKSGQSRRSNRRKRQHSQPYLNAENLARLDEGEITEENNEDESDSAAADSFHSALSLGGLARITEDLGRDIEKAEMEIIEQKACVKEAVDMYRKKYLDGSITSRDTKKQRRLKDEMKVELKRCEAELNALRAAYSDAKLELESASYLDYERELNKYGDGPSVELLLQDNDKVDTAQKASNMADVLSRARSLLEARAQRAARKPRDDLQHNLTSSLNRDILFVSFAAPVIRLELVGDEDDGRTEKILDAFVTGLVIDASKTTFDARIFSSVEQVVIATDFNESDETAPLILDGGVKPDDSRALASQYSHLVSSTFLQEDFLRLGIELRRRNDRKSGTFKESLKGKIALGVVEFCPDIAFLKKCTIFARHAKTCIKPDSEELTQPKGLADSHLDKAHRKLVGKTMIAEGEKKFFRSVDLSLQADAINIRFSNVNNETALCLSSISARMARQLSNESDHRAQIEAKLTNLQLVDISQSIELFGRTDIYHPLLNLRWRSQLVLENNFGGWVVDGECGAEPLGEQKVWNSHIGVKVNSLNLLGNLRSLVGTKRAAETVINCVKHSDETASEGTENELPSKRLVRFDTEDVIYPLRWRFDYAIGKGSIMIPSDVTGVSTPSERSNFGIRLIFALNCSLHMSPILNDAVIISAKAKEVTLMRCSDSWNLIEPGTIVCQASVPARAIPKNIISCTGISYTQLKLPDSSPWLLPIDAQEMEKVRIDNGRSESAIYFSLAISDILANYSALALAEVTSAISLLKAGRNQIGVDEDSNSSLEKTDKKEKKFESIFTNLTLPTATFTMHEEVVIAGGRSHKNPLISMSVRAFAFELSHKSERSGNFRLEFDECCIYNLTTYPGVCVLGPIARNGGRTMKSGIKITADLRMDHSIKQKCVEFDIHLGKLQLLLLPQLFKSALDFFAGLESRKKMSSATGEMIERRQDLDENLLLQKVLPLGASSLKFAIRTEGVEVLLSSRDIIAYMNSRSIDAVSVVSLRWKASFTGIIRRGAKQEGIMKLLSLPQEHSEKRDDFNQAVGFSQEQSLGDKENSGAKGPLFEEMAVSEVCWTVNNFQILRTSMKRLNQSDAKMRDIDSSICYFIVNPPVAGEQQIISPVCFVLLHDLVAVSFEQARESDTNEDISAIVNVAQNLSVDVDFIDVLLYIRQSASGLNEALHVSLRPIIKLVKEHKGHKDARKKQIVKADIAVHGPERHPRQSVSDIVKCSIMTASINIKGIQITVVPGGATRLTENPIIKFSASNIKNDIRLVPIAKNIGGGGIPYSALSHLEAVSWFKCDLSADYHNKKLVSWEPLLESWSFTGRVSADLTQCLGLRSILHRNTGYGPDSPSRPTSLSARIQESLQNRTFGDLLRSRVGAKAEEVDPSRGEENHELCSLGIAYAVLILIRENGAQQSSPSALNSRRHERIIHVAKFASERPKDWLALDDGNPKRLSPNAQKKISNFPSLSVSIADEKPMNINLTGAFMSDVVGILSDEMKEDSTKLLPPHWIRNESGMIVRFSEILDPRRIERGEHSPIIILEPGKQVPLSLRRDISQSCDPHQAFISLELDCADPGDSSGRSTPSAWDHRLRRTYRASSRIPVDSVGVYTFVLHHLPPDGALDEEIEEKEGDPNIVVRVALRGGTKFVSIESPVVLHNTTGGNIYCEAVATLSGLRLWRVALIYESKFDQDSRDDQIMQPVQTPLPANLVPFIDEKLISVSISCEKFGSGPVYSNQVASLSIPPPYSQKHVMRGIIKMSEMSLTASGSKRSQLHINTCSIRIGSVLDVVGTSSTPPSTFFIPEQRMVMLRPPIAVKNHLPTAIRVQMRVKTSPNVLKRSLSWMPSRAKKRVFSELDLSLHHREESWEEVGVVRCGESASWLGANGSDPVEMRIQLLMDNAKGGEFSRDFPDWSSAITILPENQSKRVKHLSSLKMVVEDAGGATLSLSTAMDARMGMTDSDTAPHEDIQTFSRTIGMAPRSIAIYVPFWLVDSTGIDLEYATSASNIAGQVHPDIMPSVRNRGGDQRRTHRAQGDTASGQRGLADLLQANDFAHLEAKSRFDIYMIGEEHPRQLSLRQQFVRRHDSISSTWSNSIDLSGSRTKKQDLTVRSSRITSLFSSQSKTRQFGSLALSSRMSPAPDSLGGRFGTKLIHVVNKYNITNLLDQDIEIVAGNSGCPVDIYVGAEPIPFHFHDSEMIRIRPKDYGWIWSSPFSIRGGQQEMFIRIRNRLTGGIVIAAIELQETSKAPGIIVEIRSAGHPPFRLENHTMSALQFYQAHYIMDNTKTEGDVLSQTEEIILLPYHSANYAWDRPDDILKSVIVEVADFGLNGRKKKRTLATLFLDDLAPGSRKIKMNSRTFGAEVRADGPTKVFRISDTSLPVATSEDNLEEHSNITAKDDNVIEINLIHGIGISLIDWTPKELIYVRLKDIMLGRRMVSNVEHFKLQVGLLTADNQLWVTPYPNLLTIGERSSKSFSRKRRGRAALILSWTRDASFRQKMEGVTLIQSFEFTMRRLDGNVDGELIDPLIKMLRKAAANASTEGKKITGSSDPLDFRDHELWKALRLDNRFVVPRFSGPRSLSVAGREGSLQAPFSLTAAGASKANTNAMRLQSSPNKDILPQPLAITHRRSAANRVMREAKPGSQAAASSSSKQTRKYYIERMKISAIETKISWTGKLSFAGLVPSYLAPALTFEGLPIFLSAYSVSHTYGSWGEHLNKLKGHYVNVWRVFDVFLGITFQPSFMLRAYLFTWQESAATFFDTISLASSRAADASAVLVPGKHFTEPIWDDTSDLTVLESNEDRAGTAFRLYRFVFGGIFGAFESFSRKVASVNARLAASIHHHGQSNLREKVGGLDSVRIRPPRLFANHEGNDLLVDYVEGENAGKALLSRVRGGVYLFEGYVFHGDGESFVVDQGVASDSMIFILTTQRLLLLKGGSENLNFCSEIWNASFERIVLVEMRPVAAPSQGSSKDCIFEVIHFDKDSEQDAAEAAGPRGTSRTNVGLGKLHCTSIRLTVDSGSKLISKISHLAPPSILRE